MCDDMMLDVLQYQEFIYKREDVKPYLKELDELVKSIDLNSSEQEFYDKCDEVICRFFGVKSFDDLCKLEGTKREDLELFEMYISNEIFETTLN